MDPSGVVSWFVDAPIERSLGEWRQLHNKRDCWQLASLLEQRLGGRLLQECGLPTTLVTLPPVLIPWFVPSSIMGGMPCGMPPNSSDCNDGLFLRRDSY